MLGNRPVQESELVGPICARFGLSVESSRLLISEGRKVGFVVDCGSLPLSVRCFVEEFPTPSTSQERNSSRGKALCFLPKGFKVVGLVEGSVYLGEVVYDDNWKRSYKFHLVEGADIVKSSMPCSNPTSAFKEIEAVIKVQTSKKRHRKPDARSNGKLYMAVMYSATQRLLREKFKDCASKVPEDVRPIFIEWLENRASNKAFAAGSADSALVVPHPQSQLKPAGSALPRYNSAPVTFGSESSTLENDMDGVHQGEHWNLEDQPLDSFFSAVSSSNSGTVTPGVKAQSSSNVDEYPSHGQHALSGMHGDGSNSTSSRKRASGSIDEHSPALLTRKRASGSIDEDSAIFKEIESLATKGPSISAASVGSFSIPLVVDAAELFADCFRLSVDDLGSTPEPNGNSGLTPVSRSSFNGLGGGMSSEQPFDDAKGQPGLGNHKVLSSNDLFMGLRQPGKLKLGVDQIRAGIVMLLQIPHENVQTKYVEDIMKTKLTNAMSLDEFLEALETKEAEIQALYDALYQSTDGHVTVEAIRAAHSRGILGLSDFLDMEDLREKMDSLTVADPKNSVQNQDSLKYDKFKSLMLPLPPANSIRTVIELVRANLNENELEMFSF